MESKVESILLPAKNQRCFNDSCFDMFLCSDITLLPGIVNEVGPGLIVNVPKGHIIQVLHHVCNKPWRVLNDFLYPDPKHNFIPIPLITDKPCNVNTGTVIAHFQIVLMEDSFEKIKGKCHILTPI